jgi:hypothetical protein
MRTTLSVDSLEGRALLSTLAYRPVHSGQSAMIAASNHVKDDHGHHQQAAATGTARKVPAFYEFYTGPKNRDLNVVSATVQLVPGRSLNLSGIMQGRIVKHPTTAGQQSFYVFGIDRHSSSAVTPFFQRPGVTFDAVVVVSVQTTGITASVTDLVTHVSTVIDPSAIKISGRQVSVKIDPALLPTPASGVDLAHSSFNLWPRSSLSNSVQPNHGSFVASFVPENNVARIGVVRGPIHHG